jgi:hypothetical protein
LVRGGQIIDGDGGGDFPCPLVGACGGEQEWGVRCEFGTGEAESMRGLTGQRFVERNGDGRSSTGGG